MSVAEDFGWEPTVAQQEKVADLDLAGMMQFKERFANMLFGLSNWADVDTKEALHTAAAMEEMLNDLIRKRWTNAWEISRSVAYDSKPPVMIKEPA